MRSAILRFLVVWSAVALLLCSLSSVRHAAPVHALQDQRIRTFSAAVTAETTVITGTANTDLRVLAMDIAATTTSSVWSFKDGTGGTTVFNLYLVGDAPQTVKTVFGPGGLALTTNVLTATPASSNATLTLTALTYDQP
jgi:hypothetical protein